MAFSQLSAIFLLLCVALSGCEGQLALNVNAGDLLAKAKDIFAGKVAPDVKVFNVVDNGAKADGSTDCSMVYFVLRTSAYKLCPRFVSIKLEKKRSSICYYYSCRVLSGHSRMHAMPQVV